MKIKEIYEGLTKDFLNEILDYDNIDEFEYEQINDHEFKFKTTDGSEVYIRFESFTDEEIGEYFRFSEIIQPKLKLVFNTAFSVDGFETQAKKTNLSYTLPIFKTITKINQRFISKNKPDAVTVFATSRSGEGIDKTKLRIWKLIGSKHLPSGYKIDKCFRVDNNEEGFSLIKSNLSKR
jgi:hypothetical protein